MKGLSSRIPSLDSLLLQEQTTFLGSTVRTGLECTYLLVRKEDVCVLFFSHLPPQTSGIFFPAPHLHSLLLSLICRLFFSVCCLQSCLCDSLTSLPLHDLFIFFHRLSSSCCFRFRAKSKGKKCQKRSFQFLLTSSPLHLHASVKSTGFKLGRESLSVGEEEDFQGISRMRVICVQTVSSVLLLASLSGISLLYIFLMLFYLCVEDL